MKKYLFIAAILPFRLALAQEVYLFDLIGEEISNPRNISENPGAYDNQPSFADNNTLLLSSSRAGQTDILWYAIDTGTKRWISSTSQGSEYSPLKIPGKEAISSIRLDTTGLQRLYEYDDDGNSKVLVKDLVIGYHVWAAENLVISFVLGDEMTLVVSDLTDQSNKTLQKNIGRSLHQIPGTDLISFISKESPQWDIKSINPLSGQTERIIQTIEGSEDMCWTPNGTIFMGKDNALYQFEPERDNDWVLLKTFEMTGITRLAVSPNGKKLAIVFAE